MTTLNGEYLFLINLSDLSKPKLSEINIDKPNNTNSAQSSSFVARFDWQEKHLLYYSTDQEGLEIIGSKHSGTNKKEE